MKEGITYADAGVNIEAGKEAVERIRESIDSTRQPWVVSDIGSFAGGIDLNLATQGFKHPIQVQSIDGVGTKMMIAEAMGNFSTIGIDIVNHCANDVLTKGLVKFISFLNYIGTDRLSPDVIQEIIKGMAQACCDIGCPIIGGEMAEMPDIYKEGRHDLVGKITAVVERDKIIDGSKIQSGDQLIGLASNGIHTNGFSLARKVLFEVEEYEIGGLNVTTHFSALGMKLGEELLRPHRPYVNPILNVLADGLEIRGIAHITGDGIAGNLIRILPEGCHAVVYKNCWEVPPIFLFIQGGGCIDEAEMFKVFNMGIGMIVVVPGHQAGAITQKLEWYMGNEDGDENLVTRKRYTFRIGDIEKGERGVEII